MIAIRGRMGEAARDGMAPDDDSVMPALGEEPQEAMGRG